jgi:hypothetical protein
LPSADIVKLHHHKPFVAACRSRGRLAHRRQSTLRPRPARADEDRLSARLRRIP